MPPRVEAIPRPTVVPAAPSFRSHVTLALCTLLHAFTHAYGTILVPLYLLMVADLGLRGVWQASLVVTVYGFVYCCTSYLAGILADRSDRKLLLGVGLVGNAVTVALVGAVRQYELVVALAVAAGLFGALFHPCANALVSAHYPKSPGVAIGFLGIGAGVGFFVGPQYAGWRAQAAGWHWGHVGDWQRPLLEMGALGLATGIAFLFVAKEAEPRARLPWRRRHPANARPHAGAGAAPRRVSEFTPDDPQSSRCGARPAPAFKEDNRHNGNGQFPHDTPGPGGGSVHKGHPLGKTLRNRVLAVAATLACRDFAGVASLTLASIYLQKAHGLDTRRAGFIVGAMMLVGVVINPLCVLVSPGGKRLPALMVCLVAAGAVVATVPWWPVRHVLWVLVAFQACHLGSYAISDAAILERVSPDVRGRVVGLFLTIAGTFASTSPWVMGFWTDALGDAARVPRGYAGPFGVVGGMMAFASLSALFIARLGHPTGESPVGPMSEVTPATMEPVG
jgi:MFS family permease